MAIQPLSDEDIVEIKEHCDDEVTACAYAIHRVLTTYSGRRPALSRWVIVVGRVLGFKRVVTKRFDAAITRGEELGLFTVDRESGSYPFLVPMVPSMTLDEAEELLNPRQVVDAKDEEDLEPLHPRARVVTPVEESDDLDGWEPPEMMPCGHFENPCTADGCTQPHVLPSYRDLQGKYRVPVPKHLRYSKEKAEGLGYRGLHCDSDGYYIGGPFNQLPRGR